MENGIKMTNNSFSSVRFEEQTKESNRVADQADCDIRDYGKKVHGFEIEFDETNDKLNKALESLEEKEKHLKEVEADIAALSRRYFLFLYGFETDLYPLD